ncbi:MAG: DUF4350 domain-containing protein [Deltaproteobacteria bacterium]|nr:DUF4350 domain-containing protein [Deltaproteobacteria bacterium]
MMKEREKKNSARWHDSVLVWGLVVILLVVLLLTGGGKRKNGPVAGILDYSSFGTSPDGLKAAYLLLSRTGLYPYRGRKPLVGPGLPEGALAIVAPDIELTWLEVRDLSHWVETGGRLLLVLDSREPARRLAAAFGFGVTYTTSADKQGETREVSFDEENSRSKERDEPFWTIPGNGLPELDDVPGNQMVGLVPPSEASVLAMNEINVVAASLDYGDGLVIVLSEVLPFTNKGLGRMNSAAMVRVLAGLAAQNGLICFDEYHHGLGKGLGVFSVIWHSSAGPAILELILLIMFFLWLRGRPTGRVSGRIKRERKEWDEVELLAGLYERIGNRELPVQVLRENAIAYLHALDPGISVKERIIRDAEQVAGLKHGRLENELASLSGGIRKPEILRLAMGFAAIMDRGHDNQKRDEYVD